MSLYVNTGAGGLRIAARERNYKQTYMNERLLADLLDRIFECIDSLLLCSLVRVLGLVVLDLCLHIKRVVLIACQGGSWERKGVGARELNRDRGLAGLLFAHFGVSFNIR